MDVIWCCSPPIFADRCYAKIRTNAVTDTDTKLLFICAAHFLFPKVRFWGLNLKLKYREGKIEVTSVTMSPVPGMIFSHLLKCFICRSTLCRNQNGEDVWIQRSWQAAWVLVVTHLLNEPRSYATLRSQAILAHSNVKSHRPLRLALGIHQSIPSQPISSWPIPAVAIADYSFCYR